MVIKAQSPAGFAEEYIIESIWNNRFPAGSILPAERELSELIGVTRTTLREVLQRLARDGWLTIQHGKPTKVNNFWETSGLNILETLARLDHESVPQLIDNLLSVRTNIATIFIRTAFRQHPDDALQVLASANQVEDHADAFATLDYNIFRGLAFASGNPIYGLILNGMKGLYTRIGRHYFANPEARSLALGFYHKLSELCSTGQHDQVYETVRRYGRDSGEIWHRMQKRCRVTWPSRPAKRKNLSAERFFALTRAFRFRQALQRIHPRRAALQQLHATVFILLLQQHVKAPQAMHMLQHLFAPFISGARLCGM